ncbi:putative cell survival pathways protein [Podochytrium sp. JEL0797]|nr:putative cell survival pathways protein [Podochytrium sp. JEL0797]
MISGNTEKSSGLFKRRNRQENAQDVLPPIPATRQPDPQPGSFKRSDIIPAVRTIATADDLAWKQLAGKTETATFYLSFEGGVFAMLQMIYSAIGLKPDVMVVCRVYHPDGTKEGDSLHHSSHSMKLSDNKLSASCEEMSIKHIAASNGYHVTFNLSKETMFDIDFIPSDDPFKIGTGQAFFGKDERDGYAQAAFMPKAKITGTMTLAGQTSECKGEGLFHHVIQSKPQNVSRWNFVNFQNEADALMLYEFDLPKSGDSSGIVTSQGCIVRNGKTFAITTDNRALHVQTATDPMSKYDIPTQILAVWKGKTLDDGVDVKIEISTMLDNNLERIDVLAELPFFLRKLIQKFVTAPFVFSWYERNAVAKMTVGDQVSEIEGNVLVECSFLSRSD